MMLLKSPSEVGPDSLCCSHVKRYLMQSKGGQRPIPGQIIMEIIVAKADLLICSLQHIFIL